MAELLGIGWIDEEQYGQIRAGTRVTYPPGPGLSGLWEDENVFRAPVKNYGRFDATSKLTCCACALALEDSGALEGPTGIIGTSRNGCLESNRAYFKDYVDCGRTLSRGNLFIYTLPSSSLAEAAIHLGLTGPTLYVTSPEPDPALLFDTAARMMSADDAGSMLAIQSNELEAICFVLAEPPRSGRAICGLDDALTMIENTDCTRIGALVKGFADL